MIRNNLAVLLAERQLKISRLSKETGIARSTVTSISQNDTKMMQLDVINKLCMYLNIEPNDFFVYIPIDIDFTLLFTHFTTKQLQNIDTITNDIIIKQFSFDLFLDVIGNRNVDEATSYDLSGISGEIMLHNSSVPSMEITIDLSFSTDNEQATSDKNEFINNVWNKLDPTFKLLTSERLKQFILSQITKEFTDAYISHNSNNFIDKDDVQENLQQSTYLHINNSLFFP